MRFESIKQEAAQAAVDQMTGPFYTKQISDHPVVTETHADFVENDWQYHLSIGRFLSARRVELGICKADSIDPEFGQLWRKIS